MDDGIHQIDIARKLMGEPEAPRMVQATGGRLRFPNDDAETPDTLAATWTYDGFLMTYEMTGWPLYMEKTTATIRRNDLLPYWTQNATRVEIYGTDAMLIAGRMGGGWVAMSHGGRPIQKQYGIPPDSAHQLDFLAAVKERRTPRGSIEIVNPSQELVHMANIAHRVGNTTLRWDAAAGRFEDHEAANALLLREYRDGYGLPPV
jgi:predicted dehydrogenase